MSKVTVYINNHEYTILCNDGEEGKIQSLAEEFAKRAKDLNVDFKRFSQSHAFLTLGLILLDEMHTLKNQTNKSSSEGFSGIEKEFVDAIQYQIESIKFSLDKIEKK